MLKKNIIDILKDNFLDFAEDLLPNNLPSVCDGLLPVHRKIIYALNEKYITHDKPYRKMLMNSAEVMKYYVFGDGPLTSTMKNAGSNFVLYQYLDPRGSFPDKNRKDGVGASPRYIECRLTEYSEHLLQGIKYKNVPFVPNWDESTEEPVYLPSPIPNMLINNSESIAVGFASKMPSHNLNEVCDAFINYLKTGDINSSIDLIKGCDSPLGANLIYDKEETRKILTTGRGSYQMVSTWEYNKKESCIVIKEIPMSTTIEDIDAKIRQCIEKGQLKEITGVHDGCGKDGLRYDIYIKKNADVNVVISKLRKYTPFQNPVPVYLYMLKPDGITPHLYNLKDMIEDWTQHRIECTKLEITSMIKEMEFKRNRMEGLFAIATDLDLTHKLIKEAKNEKEVIKKLTDNFGLNEQQADYISTIRMVSLNKEWISKQTKEYETLGRQITQQEKLLKNDKKIVETIIIKQLEDAKLKFGLPRKTRVLEDFDSSVTVDIVDDYSCYITCTEQGYVKKTMRYSENQKVKDGDNIILSQQTTNKSNLLIFTNKANMYTVKISSLEDSVPSSLGQYLPSFLGFEPGEEIIKYISTTDYMGNIIFCFGNGKVARISLAAYKTSLKKMTKAYNTESTLIGIEFENDRKYISLDSAAGKRVIFEIENIRVQSSRTSKGVAVMKPKKSDKVTRFVCLNGACMLDYYLLKSAGVGKTIKHF